MDTNKQTDRIKENTHPPSAQLWIGQHERLVQKATEYLQKIFCIQNACNICTTCLKIRDQQHHAIIWFYPEKQYTLDQIDIIFKNISFTLDTNTQFFFVLQKADFLPAVCANRLLKPVEEPPSGYHFLFLAERSEQILPTIRSRCMIQSFYTKGAISLHPDLFACFTSTKKQSPIDFMQLLQASKISERESVELLDAIIKHWIKKYKNATKKYDTTMQAKTEHIIAILKEHMKLLPMPGSSKLFWKNLFLQIHM